MSNRSLASKPLKVTNRLFSVDSPKAVKANKYGWLNGIHYMSPSTLGGVGNLCSHASKACIALCLGHYSGQAAMVHDLERDDNSVRKSRREKARHFMHNRAEYMRAVVAEIEGMIRKARKLNMRLCVRMNGSTDIAWEGIAVWRNGQPYRNVFLAYPELQFVDYTKNPKRFARALPANYHLTFSRSETNEAQALELLARGVNVAVVFANKPAHGSEWMGHMVIDGDLHDLRHLDPRGDYGYVIALSPKGRKAKRDTTGFVVR